MTTLGEFTTIQSPPWLTALLGVLVGLCFVAILSLPFLPGIARWWRQRRDSN